jgi:hypothetical protein
MISVFEIFRVLIGLVVFVFVLTFFLRLSDMYSNTQVMGKKLETVNTFDQVAAQTFTSENPTTFSGFRDFTTLVYEPPKVKSDVGQKTLSVPVFFIPSKGVIMLEKQCLDYNWFRFCWVYAYPNSTQILFTPLENTADARATIASIVQLLPDSMDYGYCSGDDARASTKSGFIQYLSGSAAESYQPCTRQLPEGSRIVVINSTFNFSSGLRGDAFMELSSGKLYRKNSTGGMQPTGYRDALDVAAFIAGGEKSLEFKRSTLLRELAAATKIMKERTVLVSQRLRERNKQDCMECSTLFPKACGWVDFSGNKYESLLYKNFLSSLGALESSMASGDYLQQLETTALYYESLKDEGCE